MKATVFFVSDDNDTISKFKSQIESDNQLSLRIYSTAQWDQLLEDHNLRQSVHVGIPTLSIGLNNQDGAAKVLQFAKSPVPGSGVETMEALEAKAIEAAIIKFKGNLTEAAKALGIGRATLYRKVKHFSIDPNIARKRRAA